MAQDTTQQRIIDYYRKQRESAELGAEEGKAGSAATLSRITGKLQHGTQAQRNLATSEHGILSEQGAKPVNVEDDPVANAPFMAGAAMAGIAKSLFPRVAEQLGDAVFPRVLAESAERRAIGEGAAPRFRTVPQRGAAGPSNKLTGTMEGAPSRPALKGSSPAQKALGPGKETGPDFKQPKTGDAGKPRITQTSQRAKGDNPRQKPDYKRPSRAKAKVDAKPAQKPLAGTEKLDQLPAKTKKNVALQAAEMERAGGQSGKPDVDLAHKILKEAHGKGVSWTHARDLLQEAVERFRSGAL